MMDGREPDGREPDGREPDRREPDGREPDRASVEGLWYAATRGLPLMPLHAYGIAPGTRTKLAWALLNVAIWNDRGQTVTELLQMWGPTLRVNTHTLPDNAAPLSYAARHGSVHAARALLCAGADVNDDGDGTNIDPLSTAAKFGHVELVQLLADAKAPLDGAPHPHARAPLAYAVARRHVNVVALLLTRKADVGNVKNAGCTSLHLAAKCGHVRIVKLLLQARADVNFVKREVGLNRGSALSLAAIDGHTAVVAVLLAAKAALRAAEGDEYNRPVLLASGNGHTATVRCLLDAKADPEDACGGVLTWPSPLLWAVLKGRVRVVALLLARKASVCRVDKVGLTPLMFAAEHGRVRIIRALLRASADVNFAVAEPHPAIYRTALANAAFGGGLAAASVLLEAKADVNATGGRCGYTPTYAAFAKGHAAMVDLLLDAKADVDLHGLVDCANRYRHAEEVTRRLLAAKATA